MATQVHPHLSVMKAEIKNLKSTKEKKAKIAGQLVEKVKIVVKIARRINKKVGVSKVNFKLFSKSVRLSA